MLKREKVNRSHRLFVMASIVIITVLPIWARIGSVAAANSDSNKLSSTLLHNAIAKLSPNTRSLIVVNGPYHLASKSTLIPTNIHDILPFMVLAPLKYIADGKLYPFFASQTLVYGLMSLTSPGDIKDESVYFRGFHVLSFDRAHVGDKIEGWLAKYATSSHSNNGHQLFVFNLGASEQSQHMLTMTACSPSPGLLLICADENKIMQFLADTPADSDRVLSPSFAVWEYVDTTAASWAIRRFVNDPQDPTDPHSDPIKEVRDAEAIGVAVNDWRTRDLMTVSYVSNTTKHAYIDSLLRDFVTSNLPERKTPGAFTVSVRAKGQAVADLQAALRSLLGELFPPGT